eukprot:SAG11_NODE_6898_length_1229_cov_1.825664_2_plen_21_part_01
MSARIAKAGSAGEAAALKATP